jgi:DNA-binding NarL/FixJ family response regulator
MDQERIRVLSVDDHALLREGIASIITHQADLELVSQASGGREAIQQYPEAPARCDAHGSPLA